jgi:nicotinate dehydrogenase subunit A
MASIELSVDGRAVRLEVDGDTPLLYVLRDRLALNNPHFGCGLAQCGACTVHLDGAAVRSCAVPVASAAGRHVTTLKGLGTPARPHPVQQAYVLEQVPQCGYCVNGWIMTAAALLATKPDATAAEIRQGLAGLKCRCGTHLSILRAVARAQSLMREAQGTSTGAS